MGKFLSDEQTRTYWRDGFLTPIEIMSEAEAFELRQRMEAVEAAHGPHH